VTWFKVDDAFWSHPKVVAAGNAAIGLWLRCGTYAAQHLTDGFIPAAIAKQLGSAGSAAKLVTAGLWEPVDNRPGTVDGGCGYLMHDWGDYQPYRAVALQLRENSAERQRKYREKHKVSEIRNGVTNSAPTRTRPVSENAGGRHARPREPLRVVDEQ
jgi:hypothetical protein